jgi:nicotinate-nucleotide adenylyltransferase
MPGRSAPTRVGVLGGTLDPIHAGHIETGRAASEALSLTKILVMPARLPPHRPQSPASSVFHRFAMASLAVEPLDAWMVCDDELRAEGPSYTALTLERLARQGFAPHELFFITGADAFAEIETWHRYPEVLDLANFVVISRPGLAARAAVDRVAGVSRRVQPSPGTGTQPAVFVVDARTPDVSSTDIRRRLRAGQSITGMVPPAVERHILRHGLYVERPTGEHRNAD